MHRKWCTPLAFKTLETQFGWMVCHCYCCTCEHCLAEMLSALAGHSCWELRAVLSTGYMWLFKKKKSFSVMDHSCSMWDPVPWPGINPGPTAFWVSQPLDHWGDSVTIYILKFKTTFTVQFLKCSRATDSRQILNSPMCSSGQRCLVFLNSQGSSGLLLHLHPVSPSPRFQLCYFKYILALPALLTVLKTGAADH